MVEPNPDNNQAPFEDIIDGKSSFQVRQSLLNTTEKLVLLMWDVSCLQVTLMDLVMMGTMKILS